MNKIKFIIIAGSSGGHILPAIKYINILSQIENPDQILFITNEIGSNYLSEIKSNNINKLIFNSSNKFSYIFNIILNIHIFIYNRKLSIIGFGGFITTPVLLISKLFPFVPSIPTLHSPVVVVLLAKAILGALLPFIKIPL